MNERMPSADSALRYGDLVQDREHFRVASMGTPLHPLTSARNETQAWTRWNGYLVAQRYGDPELEHAALRNACTLADLTPLAKYRITGADALAYLARLLTGRIASVEQAQARYVLMCNSDGQLLDDGLLYRLGADDYRFCTRHRHLDWLLLNREGFDVSVVDETHELAVISVQGPVSAALLKRAGLAQVHRLAPNTLMPAYGCSTADVTVARTGFTGDLGYELFVRWQDAADWWQGLASQVDLGVIPVGTEALDLARLEAGFIRGGSDYLPADRAVGTDAARTPLELGLERYVDFDGDMFNGRAALGRQRRQGVSRRLVPLLVDGSTPAHQAVVCNYRGKRVGQVSSAAWSPAAKQNIALAMLQMPWGRSADVLRADVYRQGELGGQWRRVRVRPTAGVFFDPPRRRLTPAADF
jgi:aminomethyltransferase